MSNAMMPKDFQKATANRIVEVFKSGQNRVLLADEVGLGKTIIARDVIKQVSNWHKYEGDDHFKVIYICSNINIANQNAQKLGIKDQAVNVSDSRLSMQHLKIYQVAGKDHAYEQLIPMTPATSFSMTSGCGNQSERALMYAHLKRQEIFRDKAEMLKTILAYDAEKYWNGYVDKYEEEIVECDNNCKDENKYIDVIHDELKARLEEESKFIEDFANLFKINDPKQRRRESRPIINKLRKIFAEISLDKLEPDLVVMDEFQRFRDLINSETSENEQGMLTRKFLHNKEMKVLLLSATPYKPYSTLQEITEDDASEHYGEFMELMQFLFYDKCKLSSFKAVWKEYSNTLCELGNGEMTVLLARKNQAESALYDGVCRTERVSTGVIDDCGACEVEVSEGDILSFSNMQSVLDELSAISKEKGKNLRYKNVPMDYVKSSPYLLSFMESYKLKQQIAKYAKENQLTSINNSSSKYLFISKDRVHNYKSISSNNARLEKLKEVVFGGDRGGDNDDGYGNGNGNGIENLLWLPPSRPYYDTNSIFEKNKEASKVLVFSSWEMVPRMVSTLLSYEAERLTIGKLFHNTEAKRGRGYFATKEERRYGVLRLKDEPEEVICYPCKYLAKLYSPKEHLGKNVGTLRKDLSLQIKKKLDEIRDKHDIPVYGSVTAKTIINAMKLLDNDSESKLSATPDGIEEVLANISIAGPATCALRIFDYNEDKSREFAKKIFVSMFNKAESSAIIDLLYGSAEEGLNEEGQDDNDAAKSYYEKVINYCVDGNLQAVLDEYAHLLNEKGEKLAPLMIESFAGTATLEVETKESFPSNDKLKARMRTHFAVGYFNSKISDESVQRTETIRKSFNSPFRPFVLSTTSIGQEGLDFHNYSRKIVHWNLPSNPIDLEQREGRINRFKCLAVRRNIARKYGDEYLWDEMFDRAKSEQKGECSELVPYWYMPNDGELGEKIERIVPMYPFSSDRYKYNRLIEVLSLYRLTLGQPRQEELIGTLQKELPEEITDELFINLSPFDKNREQYKPCNSSYSFLEWYQ